MNVSLIKCIVPQSLKLLGPSRTLRVPRLVPSATRYQEPNGDVKVSRWEPDSKHPRTGPQLAQAGWLLPSRTIPWPCSRGRCGQGSEGGKRTSPRGRRISAHIHILSKAVLCPVHILPIWCTAHGRMLHGARSIAGCYTVRGERCMADATQHRVHG